MKGGKIMKKKLWLVSEDLTEFHHENMIRKKETLFTLANGYRGIRGSWEFPSLGERGNYIAGVFNEGDPQVTELVNCQNPLSFNLYIDKQLQRLQERNIVDYKRYLNMREAILYSEIIFKNSNGKLTKVSAERFVSRNNVHRWGVKYTIIPLNYSGKIHIENIIDPSVTNNTFDPVNRVKHLVNIKCYDLKPGIALKTITKDSSIEIIEATTLRSSNTSGNLLTNRKVREIGEGISELYEISVTAGNSYIIEKYGVTYTSRDTMKNPYDLLVNNLHQYVYDSLEKELLLHKARWEELWEIIDIEIRGDDEAQVALRFNLFHLASSAYDGDNLVSIAAKALHGEGYKGHVFWDTEIFMLPFFIYTVPQVAKSLLLYRYNMLNGARKNAYKNGYKGAQFPWESAEDGVEVTPKWGYGFHGEAIRIWTGEEEFHINGDIALAIWQYYRATLDRDFLLNHGIEMLFEIAQFWGSRVTYCEKRDRYEINKVIGPDEFHEHVNNNFYTNYLAKWSLEKACLLKKQLEEENNSIFHNLSNHLGLTNEDFEKWREVSSKMYIPYCEDSNLIEEFEGYFQLIDIPISDYDKNQMPVWPDLLGNKLEETQLIKQADVLLLMFLLGEEFDIETQKANYQYYEKRTMHKSSLSPSIYSIMGLSVGDTQKAYQYFMKTILTDLEDNQGNTEQGLHGASTGGAWQSAVFGFGGMRVDSQEQLCFQPWIPPQWQELSYKVYWRGELIKVRVTPSAVTILTSHDSLGIKVFDQAYTLIKNQPLIVRNSNKGKKPLTIF